LARATTRLTAWPQHGAEPDSATRALRALIRDHLDPGDAVPRPTLAWLDAHGMTALVWRALQAEPACTGVGARLRDQLGERARADSLAELSRRRALREVLQALGDAGASPVLLKGAVLAHTHYPWPALRPCGDTDVLIPIGSRESARAALKRLGYRHIPSTGGRLVNRQENHDHRDAHGAEHVLDLHWAVSNSPLVAHSLGHEELAEQSVPVPALGPSARGTGPVHALLVACLHRAVHADAPYYGPDGTALEEERLLWLHDIHLLCRSLDEAQWTRFTTLARARGLATLCRDAIRTSARRLGTRVDPARLDQLQPEAPERSAALLSTRGARRTLAELGALGWSDRLRFLGELAFPHEEYLRARYPGAARTPLAVLWARRGLAGLARRLRRRRGR
jgi:hypothetical protein